MYIVYILKSALNSSYYVGCTENLENRLNSHNNGKVISTKRFKPWSLIYTEKYKTLSEARVRELQIKKWKSRAAIERLFKNSNI